MRERARSESTESTAPEIRVVLSWHDDLNRGNVEELVEHSHPDVEVGGPRGVAKGAELLREWVDRADIRLDPLRVFHRDEKVIMEQRAEWRSHDSVQVVASVFVVRGGLVTSVLRYGDLMEALRAADLDESCEVETPLG